MIERPRDRPAADRTRRPAAAPSPCRRGALASRPTRCASRRSSPTCSTTPASTPRRADGSATVEREGAGGGQRARQRDRHRAGAARGIFELFAQVPSAHSAVRRAGHRSRVGRGLVELHGGRIEARSEGRAGQRVRRPPAAGQARDPTGPARIAGAGGRAVPLHILVVDDNRDVAESLAMLLRDAVGYLVTTAYDGLAAVEAAAREGARIWCCSTSACLSSTAAARADASASSPGAGTCGIVALTGWGQEDDRRRIMEAGFDVHLVKPVRLQSSSGRR